MAPTSADGAVPGEKNMHIVVCVKHVPDTTEIRFDSATGELRLRGVPTKLNDYDCHAVEEASRLREALGATVTLLSIGPAEAARTLKEGLAYGADRAFLFTVSPADALDPAATAQLLAAALDKVGPADLILCGDVSEDGYHRLVPGMLAAKLGVPFLASTSQLELDDGTATAISLGGDWLEKYRFALPAVLSVSRAINKPRLVTALQVLKVQMSRITTVPATELDVDAAGLEPENLATRVVGMRPAGVARRNEILKGEPDEVVSKLIAALEGLGVLQ